MTGISRLAYCQAQHQAQWCAVVDHRILEMVREQQQKHPRMAVRKLHQKLTPDLVTGASPDGETPFLLCWVGMVYWSSRGSADDAPLALACGAAPS